ncbi:class I SAM-dependent DNA methyltransferase [Rufibacter immobilis]|uniref:class I SAM-dependent DNA methyltransferase n=1 Tax=Rufibacter immobilis TaxID=1348778 RepID=UPI0035EA5789
MTHKEVIKFLHPFADDLQIVNKLIIEAYISFNKIEIKRNELILSYISGNNKKLINDFTELVKVKNKKFDFDDLIHLFEITVPTKDLVVNGAVYTPDFIKTRLVKESIKELNINDVLNLKFADISCGSGAFLYTVAEQLYQLTGNSFSSIFERNIYGLDISDYSVERTKVLLSLLALKNGEDEENYSFNLFTGNALDFDWNHHLTDYNGFDAVVGNPPYVRAKHLDPETKRHMSKWEVTKSGNPDLYIPFFEIGLQHLKPNGILSYITVNTFKRSVNARSLREFFSVNSLDVSIIDFGNQQIFKNKSTYTCIVYIKNKIDSDIKYKKVTIDEFKKDTKFSYNRISYDILDNKKGWLLSEANTLINIHKIQTAGTPLGRKFSIKNGLATLRNDIFIFKPVNEDEKYYYLTNCSTPKIEKAICRDIIKPNRLKNENDLVLNLEKIIFPYYPINNIDGDSNGKIPTPTVFEENYFKDTFPFAYAYLEDNKSQLLKRDKGREEVKYKWYEFGRTQALANYGLKLLFPYMSNKPYFVFTNTTNLLFYAGYAAFSHSERDLRILQKILKSKVFWYYIQKTSKPYTNEYYALAKNYVKDFSICSLTIEEEDFLLGSNNPIEIDELMMEKYDITI